MLFRSPEGETLQAGIHAIAKETKVTGIYGKCIRKEDSLVPDENGGIIALNKKNTQLMIFTLALRSLL